MGLFDGTRPGRFSLFRPHALRAAATKAGASPGGARALHQEWQSLAFGYYDKIGECWNPAQFYARSLSKLDVLMGERDSSGEVRPTENPTVIDLFAPIREAYGGEAGIGASYGRLKFLIGEGRLTQSRPPLRGDATDEEWALAMDQPALWEFLSPTELAVRDEGRAIVRKASSGDAGVEYRNISDDPEAGDPEPGEMRMWRFWRPHPQFSQQADSPVRSVLDLYEQLWWITMGERASIQNHIANAGLLLVPREIDLKVSDAEAEAIGEDPDADPFMIRVGSLMMAAINDPGGAGAAVPGVIRADGDLLTPDRFRHIKFHEPTTSLFVSQREEALVRRISIGLDLPIEEVMGIGGANHWTAWKLDDEKWSHIQPVAQAFCDDVFAAVMRPLMIANGIDDPDRYPVIYDNTNLVTDPDKGKTAIVLHKDGALKAAVALAVNGFDPETDLMDGEEREEWLAINGAGAVEEAPLSESEPDTEEEPQPAPVPDETATLRGIAEFAVDRAREIAGAKVRSQKRSCEDCFAGLEDVPNRDLVAALGRDRLKAIGGDLSPATLVSGVVHSFLATCERTGIRVTPDLATEIELHAATTLFDAVPPPLPDSLIEALRAT